MPLRPVKQRMGLAKTFNDNGATYHGDLTKTVTHLVCNNPEGKKYEMARKWRITVVSIEWVRDSMQRGMALDESLYRPELPTEERGKGAVVNKRLLSPGTKRTQLAAAITQNPDGRKRKLRRTASARFESQDDSFWAEIGSAEGAVEEAKLNDWNEAPAPTHTAAKPPDLVTKAEMATAREANAHHSPEPASRTASRTSHPHAIFSGHTFCLHPGFDHQKSQKLRTCIEDHEGSVIADIGQIHIGLQKSKTDRITIISPYDISREEVERLRDEGIVSTQSPIKSYFWIEHCLYAKRVVSDSTPLCDPFPVFAIPGFEKLIICPTSFKGIELLHLSKAVRLMGATYEESCTTSTSLILGNQGIPNLDKLKFALNHGIPVVNADWFYECCRRGELLPIESYFPPSYAMEYERRLKSTSRGGIATRCSDQHDGAKSKPAQQTRAAESTKPVASPSGQQHASAEEHETLSERMRQSQPLRELEPRVNSPPKRAAPLRGDSDSKVEKGAKSSSPRPRRTVLTAIHDTRSSPTDLDKQDSALNCAIHTLLAQRKAASASDTAEKLPPRRHRKLGRAPSNPSSLGAASFTRAYSESCPQSEDDLLDAEKPVQPEEPQTINPSQTLTYEDPDALAAREKLLKKMGKDSWSDDDQPSAGTRVQSVGTVRNFTASGLQERSTRRKTRKQ